MITLEALEAELSCWRRKLEAIEQEKLEVKPSGLHLAALKLQERVIRDEIDDLTAKLAIVSKASEKRTHRKRLRRDLEGKSMFISNDKTGA